MQQDPATLLVVERTLAGIDLFNRHDTWMACTGEHGCGAARDTCTRYLQYLLDATAPAVQALIDTDMRTRWDRLIVRHCTPINGGKCEAYVRYEATP